MKKKKEQFNLLRARRLLLGLTQKETSFLLSNSTAEPVTRIETGERMPLLPNGVGLSVILDEDIRVLWPMLCSQQSKLILKQARIQLPRLNKLPQDARIRQAIITHEILIDRLEQSCAKKPKP